MRSKGMHYEHLALKYLKKQGLTLVTKNFSSRYGEIDLIMQDKNTLVFVEVRYRKGNNYGSAAESVSVPKQQKIILCAQHYLNQTQLWHLDCRFDIVAISAANDSQNEACINWLQAAFLK